MNTKIKIMEELSALTRAVETIDNALTRADAVETISGLLDLVASLIDVGDASDREALAAEYAAVRLYCIENYREAQQTAQDGGTLARRNLARAKTAGTRLARLGEALGVASTEIRAEPMPQQAVMISVPGREVMA